MKRVDDFRLRFGKQEFVPIITGGMGVDISTAELSLVAARLGGIGHISDAMVPTVSDRRFKTGFVKEKQKKYKYNVASRDKSPGKFDLERLAEAPTPEALNACMERLIRRWPGKRLPGQASTWCSSGWQSYF